MVLCFLVIFLDSLKFLSTSDIYVKIINKGCVAICTFKGILFILVTIEAISSTPVGAHYNGCQWRVS